MKMTQQHDTLLTETLDANNQQKMYDNICKKVLANKEILAQIMKECVIEYRDYSVKEIAERFIEGEPYIGSINVKTGENITGMSTESTNGKMFYDIRYQAIVPNGDDYIELIINIEAQNDYRPGYPLLKRGVYYGANMITGQYETVFAKSDYHKLQKVYSIWICYNVPKYLQNTISGYEITEKNLIGNFTETKENYDLLTIVMVRLGDASSQSESSVLKLLNTLLASEVNAKQKIEFLEDEFDIARGQKIEGDVSLMCDLSKGVLRKGFEKGIEQIAKKMILRGDEIADIIELTELTEAEIAGLISQEDKKLREM